MILRTVPATLATVSANGKSAVPVPVSTVIATTPALPAGDYLVEISMGYADALLAGRGLTCEHRNAADSGTVNELGMVMAGACLTQTYNRIAVAANEKVRVISLSVVGAANSVAGATIQAYRLPIA